MKTALAYSPAMLGLRFLLELVALACFAYWAWKTAPGAMRYVGVVVAPVVVAVLWGVFATPGDESRSGDTVVSTAGPVRLVLELLVLFGGAALLYVAGAHLPAMVLAGVLIAYHIASYERVSWLISH
ncbi:YrdB family protein [Streptomyces sp. NPDC050560]|uniref:YrdB family protein n=1 Tax=Streptomyces sp. NPDC050560 TaxID=3365630 RepID=UPI00378D16FF